MVQSDIDLYSLVNCIVSFTNHINWWRAKTIKRLYISIYSSCVHVSLYNCMCIHCIDNVGTIYSIGWVGMNRKRNGKLLLVSSADSFLSWCLDLQGANFLNRRRWRKMKNRKLKPMYVHTDIQTCRHTEDSSVIL